MFQQANTQVNNDGQRHFISDTTADFNAELKRVMNANTPSKPDDGPKVPIKGPEYRYIHYRGTREPTPNELKLRPDKEIYIDERGGATVCYILPEKEGDTITYTIAYCYPSTNYWKAKGRFKCRCWFKANPDNPKRPNRGPQIAQNMSVTELVQILDAEMEQWGYLRPMPKGRKQKVLMLPAPETAVTETKVEPVEPGATGLDDFPNYATG